MTDNIFMAILSKIKKISTKVDTVNANVSTVAEQVSSVDLKTTSIASDADSIKSTLATMDKNVNTVKTNVASILNNDDSDTKYLYVASDNVLSTVLSAETSHTGLTNKYIKYYKISGMGSLRLKASIKRTSGDKNAYAGCALFRTNFASEDITESTLMLEHEVSTTSKSSYSNLYIDFDVADGDIIGVYITAGASTTVTCNSITLCGDKSVIQDI